MLPLPDIPAVQVPSPGAVSQFYKTLDSAAEVGRQRPAMRTGSSAAETTATLVQSRETCGDISMVIIMPDLASPVYRVDAANSMYTPPYRGSSIQRSSGSPAWIWILFIAVPSPAFLLDGSSFVSERHDLRNFVEQHSTLSFPKPSD